MYERNCHIYRIVYIICKILTKSLYNARVKLLGIICNEGTVMYDMCQGSVCCLITVPFFVCRI